METAEQEIFGIIQDYCGLEVNDAHRAFVCQYIKSRCSALNLSVGEYRNRVLSTEKELALLINEAAINETYFFREEQQFDYLKDNFFKRLHTEPLVIWSAACSTGEEAISLLAMTVSCGLDAHVYATDIDTAALSILEKGLYATNSFRADGRKYLPLLDAVGKRKDGLFEFSSGRRGNLHQFFFNLNGTEPLPFAPGTVDLIFLRNVFIYFDAGRRNQIMRRISSVLKKNGLLFLSVNEVAGVECSSDIPLLKENAGNVYFFRKVDAEEKKLYMERTRPASVEGSCAVRAQGFNAGRKAAAVPEPRSPGERDFSGIRQVRAEHVIMPSAQDDAPDGISLGAPAVTEPESGSAGHEALAGIEGLFSQAFSILGTEDSSDRLQALVGSFRFLPQQSEFKLYLQALAALERGDSQSAVRFFEKSLYANPGLWPAKFRLGTLYAKSGRKHDAEKTMRECANLLKDYLKQDKICYNFMVEQFSPAYFLALCENFLTEKNSF